MTDLLPYQTTLAGLTRRPVEKIDAGTMRAYFTRHRFMEVSVEGDGSLSAWAVAKTMIAGREIVTALYVGDMREPTKVPLVLAKARALVQEVVNDGSRAAPLLGDGADVGGRRVLLYASRSIDPAHAAERLEVFANRNGVSFPKVAAKRSRKAA